MLITRSRRDLIKSTSMTKRSSQISLLLICEVVCVTVHHIGVRSNVVRWDGERASRKRLIICLNPLPVCHGTVRHMVIIHYGARVRESGAVFSDRMFRNLRLFWWRECASFVS